MKTSKTDWIESELLRLKEVGLFNEIKIVESSIDNHLKIDGKSVLNFCSNNYLGLANHSRIKKAAIKAIEKYGVGPGAVRSIAGNNVLHDKLEERLAQFKKCEAVIVLQSGFIANLATIPALVGKEDTIFSDELNHASIIDACRLSSAHVVRYAHCNPEDLEEKIKQNKRGKLLIVTDGVFSMDGDIAPLPAICKVAQKYGTFTMVDDAHGEGVLGGNGRGVVDHFGLHGKVDIEVGTLSKAFGVVGGFVAGSKLLVDWLKQRSRPFLFSSALTIPDTAASLEAVNILEKSDSLIKKLWENTNYFKSRMNESGFNTGNTQTPIVPVMLGSENLAQSFSKLLFKEGVFAKAIAFPTVARGFARIRVMNSASHTRKDLDQAIETFIKVGNKLKVL